MDKKFGKKEVRKPHQFTIGVFGIIFDDQKRVLLCHRRDYDLWNLPGGGVESGESPWDYLSIPMHGMHKPTLTAVDERGYSLET